MKLKLSKFQDGMEIIDVVPANDAIESSKFVQVQANKNNITLNLCGTIWANASISALDEGGKWTAFLERGALRSFLRTAVGEQVEMFYDKDKVVLRAGQRLEMPNRPAISGYETWKPSKDPTDLTAQFKTIIQAAGRYCPKTPGMEYADAICCIDKFGLVATNTVVLFAVCDKATGGALLPSNIAEVAAKAKSQKICIDAAGIGVVTDVGSVYQPLPATLDDYPRDKCLEIVRKAAAVSDYLFTLSTVELLSTLKAASEFLPSGTEVAADTAIRGSTITFNVFIGTEPATNNSAGSFQRSLTVKGKAAPGSVGRWPVRWLIPWVEYVSSYSQTIEHARLGEHQSVIRCKDATGNLSLVVFMTL